MWGTGYNDDGQLGLSGGDKAIPTLLSLPTDVVQVAPGAAMFTMFLDTDGTVREFYLFE